MGAAEVMCSSCRVCTALRALVRRQTGGGMLHVVMADGGFDVSGLENIQVRAARIDEPHALTKPIPSH